MTRACRPVRLERIGTTHSHTARAMLASQLKTRYDSRSKKTLDLHHTAVKYPLPETLNPVEVKALLTQIRKDLEQKGFIGARSLTTG
jgi:hypothetical protein